MSKHRQALARKARVSNLPAVRAALAERDAAHAEAHRLTVISEQLGTPEAKQAAREAQGTAAAAYDRHIEVWYEAAASLDAETAADAKGAALLGEAEAEAEA
jgi:hypothetical protein